MTVCGAQRPACFRMKHRLPDGLWCSRVHRLTLLLLFLVIVSIERAAVERILERRQRRADNAHAVGVGAGDQLLEEVPDLLRDGVLDRLADAELDDAVHADELDGVPEHELAVKMLWQFLGVLADRLDVTSSELRTPRAELSAEAVTRIENR